MNLVAMARLLSNERDRIMQEYGALRGIARLVHGDTIAYVIDTAA